MLNVIHLDVCFCIFILYVCGWWCGQLELVSLETYTEVKTSSHEAFLHVSGSGSNRKPQTIVSVSSSKWEPSLTYTFETLVCDCYVTDVWTEDPTEGRVVSGDFQSAHGNWLLLPSGIDTNFTCPVTMGTTSSIHSSSSDRRPDQAE